MASLLDILGYGSPQNPVPMAQVGGIPLMGSVYPGSPIIQNLPANTRALSRLRATIAQGNPDTGQTYSDPLQATLDEINRQRIARGQSPMSQSESFQALNAGQTLNAQSPVPERGAGLMDLPGNAVADVRDLFTSIPKLPFMLMQEAGQIPHIPQLLSAAMNHPGFGDKIKALAQLPIANLVPGVYTASNILSGDFGEMMRHPVMTGLDVLPYAKAEVFPAATAEQLAKRLPTVETGAALTPEEVTAANVLRGQKETQFAARGVEPTDFDMRLRKGELRQAVADLKGEAAPNQTIGQFIANSSPLGAYKDSLANKYRGSLLGQVLGSGVGKTGKGGSQVSSFYTSHINDLKNVTSSPNWQPGGTYYELAKDTGTLEHAIQGFDEWQKKYVAPDAVRAAGWDPLEWQKRTEQLTRDIQLTPDKDAFIASLSPFEAGMVGDAQKLFEATIRPFTADSYWSAEPGHTMAYVNYPDRPREIFTIPEAKKIETARRDLRTATERHIAATAAGVDDLNYLRSNDLRDFLLDSTVSDETRQDVLVAHLYAYAEHGHDTQGLISSLRKGTLKVKDLALMDSFDSIIKDAEAPGFSRDRIKELTRPLTKTGRKSPIKESVAPFVHYVQDGEWSKALEQFNTKILNDRRRYADLPKALQLEDPEAVRVTLRREGARDRSLHRLQDAANESTVKKAAEHVATVETSTFPARFTPRIEAAAKDKLTAFAQAMSANLGHDPALADQLSQFARDGQLSALEPYYQALLDTGATKTGLVDPISGGDLFPDVNPESMQARLPPSVDDLFNGYATEASKTWQDLGNPGFVHSYGQHEAPGYVPRVSPKPHTPTQDRARTLDMRPLAKNMAVSLDAMQTERLVTTARDAMVDLFLNGDPDLARSSSVATKAELDTAFRPYAERISARSGQPINEVLDNLILKQFNQFDPTAYSQYADRSASQQAGGLYIEKSLQRTLDELLKPPKFHQFLDPVMGVFRTSVLTLSPRWQIYNLLGNSLQMLVQSGVSPLKHLRDATELVRYFKDPAGVEAPAALSKISEAFQHSLNQYGREMTENHYRTGQGLAQAVGEERAMRLTQSMKGVRKVGDTLTRMNGAVDNAFRIMTYLDEYDKTFTTSKSLAQTVSDITGDDARSLQMRAARTAGEGAVRRFMYSWDDMTPMERNTMRMIFPFYGFMSHMMRFAYRFAVDHPVRIAVTAGFARNEMNDWKSGLPERLRGMAFPGGQPNNSYVPGTKVKGINMAGWNPFADVANMMTLTGWLSQANPVISTIAEQFGIDPRTGQANLYPTSAYDPETGRLKLQTRNPIVAAVENLIPQSQVVTSALGLNPEMESLKRTNPDAAARLQLTSFGIPILARDVNLSQEAMTAESARSSAYKQALSTMLKSPKSGTQYPSLEAYRQQILQLQGSNPQSLGVFTPAGVFDPRAGTLSPLPNAPEVTSPQSPYRQALQQQLSLQGTPANPQGGP